MPFRFALVTDTHLTPERDDYPTPWRTIRLANARARFVVAQIRQARPDFVIHLGDKVHPVPTLDSYPEAVAAYRKIFGGLDCPLHTLPGNHDIGDKPRAWMPASVASPETAATYRRHFGPEQSAFSHRGCRFLLVNNPIWNAGSEAERAQRAWLEQELAAASDERIFLCMHYPAFLAQPEEAGHYENLDEPARGWLLDLLARHRVEAVFAGHTHNFFYNRHAGADLYVLPSVAFVRQDYAELFRAGPEAGAEWGRDDTGKFGWALVTVQEQGHDFRFVASGGQVLDAEPDEIQAMAHSSRPADDPTQPPPQAAVGVDLRHPWAELTDFPYNYLPDEFNRNRVRNDYPLLALWRLGIRRVRAPLADLLDPGLRQRMADWHASGMHFSLFCLGLPSPPAQEVLANHRHLLERLEIVLPWAQAEAHRQNLRALGRAIGVPLFLSPLRTSGSALGALKQGVYFVRHGLAVAELAQVEEQLEKFAQAEDGDGVRGFAFRAGAGEEPPAVIDAVAEFCAGAGVQGLVHVQLAGDATADAFQDDAWLRGRVVAAQQAAARHPSVAVFLDTFADVDRGYFVRNGLVDRRYNLRAGGYALRAAARPRQK